MENVTLSVTAQFSQEDFEVAYMLLENQFKEQTPPKEFFLTGPNTLVNYTSLYAGQSSGICHAMMAAKLSFVAAEKTIDELKQKKSNIITDLNS